MRLHKKKLVMERESAYFLDEGHDVGFVEYEGKGIKNVLEQIKEIKNDMNRMAFGLISPSNSTTVAEAISSQKAGVSVFTTLANEIDSVINSALVELSILSNKELKQEAKIVFDKDFTDSLFAQEQLKLLVDLAGMGLITKQTLLNSLIKKGVLPKNFIVQDEIDALEAENPYG